MVVDIAAIITAISAIIATICAFFQYSKNKMTDFKVEQIKQ